MFVWWRYVIKESTFQRHHTGAVQMGLRCGITLFIVSKIIFFTVLFWPFFHSNLTPTVEIVDFSALKEIS